MPNSSEVANAVGGILFFLLMCAGLIGWVMNIGKLFMSGIALADWSTMEIMRLVGVFLAPIGAVLGWM